MKLLISSQSVSKTGKLSYAYFQPANSLLKNYMSTLYTFITQFNTNFTDTAHNVRSLSAHFYNFRLNAPANDSSWGILLGTSAQAITKDDYSLIAPITHGTGTGQLLYQVTTFPAGFTVDGNDVYFDVRRTFINNSGSNITYNEIGLVSTPNNSWLMLWDRTLENYTILNGEGRIITYRFIKTF